MADQPPTPEQVRVFLAGRRLRHHGWARFQTGTRRAALRQVRRMTEQDTTAHHRLTARPESRMLGIIPTATVLDMLTVDDDDTPDALYVRDVLNHKRTSAHYASLLNEICRDGMALPIMIRTHSGQPWLVDGHHRVAAALDLGIPALIWSDLPVEIEDRPHNAMMRGGWGPYRPTA